MSNNTTTKQVTVFKNFKYLNLLYVMYITLLLIVVSLANRFVLIGGITQAGGIFVFPATFLICDIVCEIYGYATARTLIWLGAICEFIFAIATTSISHMPSPTFFKVSSSYQTVFDPTIRYVIAGLCGLLFGEFINIYLLTKWRIKLNGKLFCLRTIIATAIGQLSLSIIVDIIAFYGKLTFEQLLLLILHGFTWKMLFTLLFIYPSWAIKEKLKKLESIILDDAKTDYNPFKI